MSASPSTTNSKAGPSVRRWGSMFDAAFLIIRQRVRTPRGRGLCSVVELAPGSAPALIALERGAGMGLLGSPSTWPARGASLCGAGPCVCSATSAQGIRVDDHHDRIALRVLGSDNQGRRHNCDVGESSLGEIVVQFLADMRRDLRVRRGLSRIHRRERGPGESGAQEENKQSSGRGVHRFHLQIVRRDPQATVWSRARSILRDDPGLSVERRLEQIEADPDRRQPHFPAADGAKPLAGDPRFPAPGQRNGQGRRASLPPPSGPAIPVTLTATSAREARSAPSAIATAV